MAGSEFTQEGAPAGAGGTGASNTGPGEPEEVVGTVAGAEFAQAQEVAPTESQPPAETSPTTCNPNTIWLWVILNILAAAYAWYRYRNSAVAWRKYLWLIGLLLVIVPLIIWYPSCNLLVWFIVTLIALIISLLLKDKAQGQPQA